MTPLAAYLVLFVAVGAAFVLVHLLLGKLIRPAKPDPEKGTIYECGEPTIGSAWIQFDLRFYVVALLFVIFDVEVAFFFPWAEVFGKANALAATAEKPASPADYRDYASKALALTPAYPDPKKQDRPFLESIARATDAEIQDRIEQEGAAFTHRFETIHGRNRTDAASLGWAAFWEIVVFFGVLLVGFAYLWKRGDLAWVRSVAAERTAPSAEPVPAPRAEKLVGAGSGS
jgi:NADH-quinone oxidoreductase subunit A